MLLRCHLDSPVGTPLVCCVYFVVLPTLLRGVTLQCKLDPSELWPKYRKIVTGSMVIEPYRPLPAVTELCSLRKYFYSRKLWWRHILKCQSYSCRFEKGCLRTSRIGPQFSLKFHGFRYGRFGWQPSIGSRMRAVCSSLVSRLPCRTASHTGRHILPS